MRRLLLSLSVGLGVATAATLYAASTTNGYTVIPERNSFALKEPKPFETPPPTPQPTALPKLTLTGITTILGTKQALFKAVPPARPGETQKEESYILAEGQKEGFLEVVDIDEEQGRVRVRNSGTLLVLDIDRDGPKPPSAGTNVPFQVAGASGTGVNTSAVPALPPTGVRSNPYYRGNSAMLTNLAQYSGQAGQPAYVVTNQIIVPALPPPPIIVDQRLSPEEQAVLSEVQREINDRRQGVTSGEVTRGNLPATGTGSALLPPTSGTTGAMPRPSIGVPLTELGTDAPLPGTGVPPPPPAPSPSPSQRQTR